MHLEIVSTKSINLFILEGMQRSLPDQLRVYDQLYFTQKKPISIATKIKKETDYEFGFSFNIEGEVAGKSIALIDTYEKNLDQKQIQDLENATQEGLNILIGKSLAQLDNDIDLMSIISVPTKISLNDKFLIKDKYDLKVSVLYSMEFNNKMYNCRLYYLLNKKNNKGIISDISN